MEKIRRHLGEHLKPVKLYFDDIEELMEIFQNAGDVIQIEADDYKLASAEEILSIKKPYFTNLTIRERNSSLSIDFSGHQIWLYVAEDTPTYRGLFEQIKDLLRKRRRAIAPSLHGSLPGVLMGSSVWFFLRNSFKTTGEKIQILIGVCLIIIGLLWSYLGYRSRYKQFSIIIPARRSASPSFWIRNKDQVALALISAAFGAVATLVISYILR